MKRRGRKDVGVGGRSWTRCSRPLAGTWGVREVSAPRNSDCSAEADGSLMFPEVLRPAPGEGKFFNIKPETVFLSQKRLSN